jgi:hypothetical protein
LNRYPDGITALWTYNSALVKFRLEGSSSVAKESLATAKRRNAHVPNYLSGKKRMPREIAGHYSIGSVEEAVMYADLCGKYWKDTPGAIAWLESEL